MKPELLFSLSNQNVLDNIKVKKTVTVFPVRFSASGKFNLESKQFLTKLTCKDVLFKGKITYDSEQRALEYRKRFPLPIPVGRNFGCCVAMAKWSYNQINQCWDPGFRFGVEFHQPHFGGAELHNFNSVNLKPKLFMKNIGLEARAQAKLQLPHRLSLDISSPFASSPQPVQHATVEEVQEVGGAPQATPAEPPEVLGLHFDLKELNLVFRL